MESGESGQNQITEQQDERIFRRQHDHGDGNGEKARTHGHPVAHGDGEQNGAEGCGNGKFE